MSSILTGSMRRALNTKTGKTVAQNIITMFETGNVPKPIASTFFKFKGVPMADWSPYNRFLCALGHCIDGRGYKQWADLGRTLKEDDRTARTFILYPIFKKKKDEVDEETGEPKKELVNFGVCPIFDVTQTEGDPLPEEQSKVDAIRQLPLAAVAEAWGLELHTYDREVAGYSAHAFYRYDKLIAMGTPEAKTFLHELMHAADRRTGHLTPLDPQWKAETVAEFGAATLTWMLGLPLEEQNLGDSYRYIKTYAEAEEVPIAEACMLMLDRTLKAIDEIIKTAVELDGDNIYQEVDIQEVI